MSKFDEDLLKDLNSDTDIIGRLIEIRLYLNSVIYYMKQNQSDGLIKMYQKLDDKINLVTSFIRRKIDGI